ncbi:MAG: hypothetical protein ACRD0L_13465 [Acidimicrobiales bacterium]
MRPLRHLTSRAWHLVSAALIALPLAGLATLTLAFGSPGMAYASSSSAGLPPSASPPGGTTIDPLQYQCTVDAPSCNAVGTTHDFYNGTNTEALYTEGFFCDKSVSSHSSNGCEAGAKYNNLPPGVPNASNTDPLYIPVPLFKSSELSTPGPAELQCPATAPCIDHPHSIDLSRLASTLDPILGTTPTQLQSTPLPGHDHVITSLNNNRPEWWPVVVVGVTNETAWNEIVSAKSYAEIQTLQANSSSGVTANIPTNVFLYFQVLPGTVPEARASVTSMSVPPSGTNADGTTFTNLKNDCTENAGSTCENVGITHDWINGQNVDALYSQNFFCDRSVSSKDANGCEAGAGYKALPPGVSSATFTDPLYIPVPLFKPAPSYLQCQAGKTCIDHPSSIDLSRLSSVLDPILGTTPSQLASTPLPGHDHIITTRNQNQPEWWPVVVIGVTNPSSWAEIEAAKSYSEVQALQAQPNSGVTANIPTNAFLWFTTLPGNGPNTPPPGSTPPLPTTGTSTTCMSTLPPGSVVGGAATANGGGYWAVDSAGDVAAFGNAHCYGSLTGIHLNAPIVGIAPDHQTGGYWLVASDGGVFSFNAPFHGSAGNVHLAQPVVGMAATPDGNGYFLVAKDGGVFTYGDAHFHGSVPGVLAAGQQLNAPVVGIATDAATGGYWVAASDGGVFSFDAAFHGSLGGIRLNKPVVGIKSSGAAGSGYRMVASDGGVFDFGSAVFHGSAGNITLNRPVVGLMDDSATGGYWLVASDGGIFSYQAPFHGSAA